MQSSPFKLSIADGKKTLEIPREVIKYFGLFQTIHDEDDEINEFSEDTKFRLDRLMWTFILSVVIKHDALYRDNEPLKKAIEDNEEVKNLLTSFSLGMLYSFIRTLDHYEVSLFLMATLREIMRRLLCTSIEQLYITHREIKRVDDNDTRCTTLVGVVVGDCARQSLILEILRKYIGVSLIIDMVEDHFLPRIDRLLAVASETGYFMVKSETSLILTKTGVVYVSEFERPLPNNTHEWSKYQPMKIDANVVSMFATANTMYFLTSCGELYSDGQNYAGQLGRETSLPYSTELGKVSLDFVVDIAASTLHAIALTANGVYVWGGNTMGQVGNGNSFIDEELPRRLDIDASIIEIGASETYSAMLSKSGDLYVCGLDVYLIPTKIDLPGRAKKMMCLYKRIVLLLQDDSLYVWSNLSVMNNGSFVDDKPGPIVMTMNLALNTERIFADRYYVYVFSEMGHLYQLHFRYAELVKAEPILFEKYAIDKVIEVAECATHTLILKRDGLYGMGKPAALGLNGRLRIETPERIPIVVGHEGAIDTPSHTKRRKVDNGRLACHKCGLSETADLSPSLFLHRKSNKLFCGQLCFDKYHRNTHF